MYLVRAFIQNETLSSPITPHVYSGHFIYDIILLLRTQKHNCIFFTELIYKQKLKLLQL